MRETGFGLVSSPNLAAGVGPFGVVQWGGSVGRFQRRGPGDTSEPVSEIDCDAFALPIAVTGGLKPLRSTLFGALIACVGGCGATRFGLGERSFCFRSEFFCGTGVLVSHRSYIVAPTIARNMKKASPEQRPPTWLIKP
jgi:hypothetical protein